MWFIKLTCFLSLLSIIKGQKTLYFPSHFKFGVATAAYQVEGAWNVSDKAESVWDHFTHFENYKIKDRSNGDEACDSYHNYKRDVEMLKEMEVDFYRFSISWGRLVPDPFSTRVSEDGLRYYNDLINELIKNNIEPVVTLFHWDTPYHYQKMGGWTNPLIIDQFAEYARIAFRHFGDRVRTWITFNEAYNMCLFGYGTKESFLTFAPDLQLSGYGDYQCGHNVLKAHAKAYHIYQEEFKAQQGGRLSMAFVINWPVPESDSEEDKAIAAKALEFNVGWFAHPIFLGDYPKVMRDEIDSRSKLQGYNESRLPHFTNDEINYIRGTADFTGVNYYTAIVFRNSKERPSAIVPSQENDLGYIFYQPDDWPSGASKWLKLNPKCFRNSLNWIWKNYKHEIIISENGFSSTGGLKDITRINSFNDHLYQVQLAMQDGANISAFTAWSLMDNFEWVSGYTERFGLYQVDFKSPNKTRTPRLSVFAYKKIIKSRKINFNSIPEVEGMNMDDEEIESTTRKTEDEANDKILVENNNDSLHWNTVITAISLIISLVLLLVVSLLYKKNKKFSKRLQLFPDRQ